MKSPAASLGPFIETSPRSEHILFAFSARERSLFLPDLRLEEFDGTPYSYLDTDLAGLEGWDRTLREIRPTVLVTAWSAKRIPPAWMDSEEFSLKYVCHITGALKSVMTAELFERGVRASNWGTVINHTVAEHAMLLVLALLRGAAGWPASIDRGGWTVDHVERLRTRSLRGKRVGLHGFGAIAREIAALLAPFRPAAIRAYSHGVPTDFMAAHGVLPCRSLDALFADSEVLIDCESLTAANRGSVDARLLGLLPDDAVFVNVGRGPIVDEAALLAEAGSGRLRIGLDVFHREPLPADSPLRDAPSVLLSPHIAGPTWDTYRLCGDHALENLRSYLSGGPLSGEVTPLGFARMT